MMQESPIRPAGIGPDPNVFSARLDSAYALLAPYGDCASLAPLQELQRTFARKTQDFFREGRCFTIAVLGQVKAGKSSFLNELFFGGEELLPQSALPRTAVLTRLEYAPEHRLTVDYYTAADWTFLERTALEPGPSGEAAGEMLARAAACGERRAACARLETERFCGIGLDELHTRLDACVSEGGALSPLVKSVTIGLCHEALRGVAVVDTPGLNDPVLSRTQRAQSMIELSDAAFFLSRSCSFLDENDLQLLAGQLPRKGIRRLILVASQYDSALMDTLWTAGSLAAAGSETRARLARHAAESIGAAAARMRRAGFAPEVTDVLLACRVPVFCSVLAQRMAGHGATQDNAQEQVIRRVLSSREPITAQQLAEIGGMDEAHRIIETLCAEKDAAMRQKARDFLLPAQADFQSTLAQLRAEAAAKAEKARARAQDERRQANALAARLSEFRIQAQAFFAEYTAGAPTLFGQAAHALRQEAARRSSPVSKTDVHTHSHTEVVSDAVLLLPWTWGRRHREYSVQQTETQYQDIADTVEDLQLFTRCAVQMHARAWEALRDTDALEEQLSALGAALEGAAPAGTDVPADTAGTAAPQTSAAEADAAGTDTARTAAAAHRALTRWPAPHFSPDCAPLCARLRQQFPGRQTTARAQAELAAARRSALESWSDELACRLEDSRLWFERCAAQAQEHYLSLICGPLETLRAEKLRRAEELERTASRLQELEELTARC